MLDPSGGNASGISGVSRREALVQQKNRACMGREGRLTDASGDLFQLRAESLDEPMKGLITSIHACKGWVFSPLPMQNMGHHDRRTSYFSTWANPAGNVQIVKSLFEGHR